MMKTVQAKFANGVLTPLEPLDLDEGAVVVLNIETAPPQAGPPQPKFRVVPNNSGFVPDVDPKKLKQILNDEDDEHYLRLQNKAE